MQQLNLVSNETFKKFTSLLVLQLFCVFTLNAFSNGTNPAYVDIKSNSFTGRIFPSELARLVLEQRSRTTPNAYDITNTWNPVKEDVYRAEEALTKYANANNINLKGKKLPEYYRQYVGVYLNGVKYLYINGIHSSTIIEDDNWRASLPEKKRTMLEKRYIDTLSKYVDTSNLKYPAYDWHVYPVSAGHGGTYYFGAYFNLDTSEVLEFITNQ